MAEEVTENGNIDDNQIGTFQWELPTAEFEGLWENLIYDINECPKIKLANFISTSLKFAHSGVDPKILTRNNLILLTGPPGTGKITLCKAVSQKMAIRTQRIFKQTLFVEVNSHSLFSKWFSESGKLIQKLFSQIEGLAERTDRLIFVLIDEVESLTIGRESAFAGNDPTDSIRAVNAMLTQLDRLKRFSNVFILCTSNIERALDSAFVDRIGLILCFKSPKSEVINSILINCINEMKRVKGLFVNDELTNLSKEFECQIIRKISSNCQTAKLSGRTIRKLPTIAYSMVAQYLDENYYGNGCYNTKIKFCQFLFFSFVESERLIGKEIEKDYVNIILKEFEVEEIKETKDELFNFDKLKDFLPKQNSID
ncbi:AAA domain-containing protein [Meloidogyne graminicola]|uniref:AAA domain-containing protein n=1 Tax=Meloidogyne graminicola TaxID=189291 RepID=A0A8S9ZLW4_9BILA|nr:AAA domain-containing protein [Meloidogyne graminicola]